MTYQEFIKELIDRFGEERGTLMALRAEVGFLRRFIEQQNMPGFMEQQEAMIQDFLGRHQDRCNNRIMNKETIIAGAVALIIGILIAPVLTPAIPWSDRMMGSQIDSHFIEQMIPHHEDAITMSNLALTRAEHPEIKTLANDIIKAQSEEIDQMKEWYKTWFGNEVSNSSSSMGQGMGMMMHGGMMGNETDIETLEDAELFDKEFIEQMIPHHQMAVTMAQMLSRGTTRSEMKQLAENIITSQTREINQMREWYRAWYGN